MLTSIEEVDIVNFMVKMANIIYLMSLAQFLAEITGEWVVPWVGVGLVGSAIQTSHFVWLKNWR